TRRVVPCDAALHIDGGPGRKVGGESAGHSLEGGGGVHPLSYGKANPLQRESRRGAAAVALLYTVRFLLLTPCPLPVRKCLQAVWQVKSFAASRVPHGSSNRLNCLPDKEMRRRTGAS